MECTRSSFFVIVQYAKDISHCYTSNSNTFSDWRRTCTCHGSKLSNSLWKQQFELLTRTWSSLASWNAQHQIFISFLPWLIFQSKKALKNILQKCVHLPALEPLLNDAPPHILKHVVSQFAKVLPHDAKARRLFVTSGGLRKVQEIKAERNSELSEHINTINNCYPEEIVRWINAVCAICVFSSNWLIRAVCNWVIILANHKRCRQFNEPIKTRSHYMHLFQSAGKRVGTSYDWI